MDRLYWNSLVKAHAPQFGAFLQSWEWGAFQETIGRRVERVLVEDERGVMLAQAVELDLPCGFRYWQVAKGPIGTMPMPEMVKELKRHLPHGVFVRVEPQSAPSHAWKAKDIQPSTSSVLDLTQGSEEIFAHMKPKTRYNLRLAEKKGVTARIAGAEGIEDWERLLTQTAARDKFSLHPLPYYAGMLEVLNGQEVHAFLAFAEFDGRPLAANLTIDFNGQRTYLHGASSNLHRNLMAPGYLHRFLIEDALAHNFSSYDFWGVAPVDARANHPWSGITQFKLGFGGEIMTTPGTFDIPESMPLYSIYRGTKMLQKIRCGLRRH